MAEETTGTPAGSEGTGAYVGDLVPGYQEWRATQGDKSGDELAEAYKQWQASPNRGQPQTQGTPGQPAQGTPAGDPLGDYRGALDADPDLRKELERHFGRSDRELGEALSMTNRLVDKFGNRESWDAISEMGDDPRLISLGHRIARDLAGKEEMIERLQKELRELRQTLGNPHQPLNVKMDGRTVKTSALDMEIQMEELRVEYDNAASSGDWNRKQLAAKKLEKASREWYSSPAYRARQRR
jgi:hypothetical protein